MEIKAPPAWLAWVERIVAIAAGLIAIWGVFVWLSEAPDRKEERDQRRSDQIARANEILSSAGRTKEIRSERDPNIEWAINKLAQYGQPAVLEAETVDLSNLKIDCATLRIRARSARLSNAEVRSTQIAFRGETFDAYLVQGLNVLLNAQSIDQPVIVNLERDTIQNFVVEGAQKPSVTRKPVTFQTNESEFKDLFFARDFKTYRLPGLSSFPGFVSGAGIQSLDEAADRCVPGTASDKAKGHLECQVMGRIDDSQFKLTKPGCRQPIFGMGIDRTAFSDNPADPPVATAAPAAVKPEQAPN